MELPADRGALLDGYVAPVSALAGDRRTGRLLEDVVHGIIGSESLVCSRIAALSPSLGRGPL
jgi:hypothetical protein